MKDVATAAARWLLVAAYGAGIVVCWTDPDAPCLLWTVVMPMVPITIVLLGFHTWRRVCPLAAIASVGSRVSAGRRGPRWMDRWALLFAYGMLVLGLVARHLVFNGDRHWLGFALVSVAATATVINALASGKSWCNLVCPVGVVERVYTDGSARRGASRCSSCTGCKSRCPDIDQGRAYRAELRAAAVRIVSFSLPGLVFGFYAYYAVRYGSWDAFFDGAWTTSSFDRELALGEGVHAVAGVPAVVACPLFLIACATISFFIWSSVERLLGFRSTDHERLRHRLLTLASFCAFNLFYLFAGQPTLLAYPALDRLTAFVVPVVSTLALARRWSTDPKRPRRRLPVV